MGKKISAKEAQRLYIKEWRARNKEKVKQYNRSYWERKAEEMNKAGKEAHKDE